MGEGFHGPSESLLADEGELVSVIDDNPSEAVWLGMGPFAEIVHLVTDCMDASVFLACEPEDRFQIEGGFFANHVYEIF